MNYAKQSLSAVLHGWGIFLQNMSCKDSLKLKITKRPVIPEHVLDVYDHVNLMFQR